MSDISRTLGGKASALRALEGLPIPEGFVVGPELPDAEIEAAVARVSAWGGTLAVRSSAVDEDGAQVSFAGQLESFLQVPPEEVAAKVRLVRASGFSERLRAYRREHGLGEPLCPAVLIQRMVQADKAGVAFSVDPVEGRWDRVVVAAVPGLGDGLVDGSRDAVTWRLDAGNAVQALECPEGLAASLMTDAELAAVADLARTCARRRGLPQDIEWAMENGKLFLLQSRPVTTMGRRADPTGELALWDNSNIAESYGGVTTPLTFSFARGVYAEVYRGFCRLMGVSAAVIRDKRSVFEGLLGLQRGRMYYQLLNWYRLLACFPGFSVNRSFMEQMMGVGEGLPERFLEEFRPARGWALGRARLRSVAAAGGLLVNFLTLPRQIKRFYRRLNLYLSESDAAMASWSPDALAREYRRLEEGLLRAWDAPLVNDFFAMIFFGSLRGLCRKWCGDNDDSLQNRLMAGQGAVISAEPARRILQMAERVRGNEEWMERLREKSALEIERELPSFPELAEEIRAYQERFSDRCLEELKLESPTLRDDPLPLYRAIAGVASQAPRAVAEESEYPVPHAGGALRRWMFAWVLGQARSRVRDRENLRFERTRVFGRVRRLFRELGIRLAAAGVLATPEDVFYLSVEEVLGFVEGGGVSLRLRETALLRRAEFAGYAAAEAPPARFFTRGWVGAAGIEEVAAPSAAGVWGENERKGLGCSPGRVRGQVRVVRDPRGVEVAAGTVLVAERTDPGWILLFPAAAGLLVERGSLLSHSAIVSRELGLPCVVGLKGACDWLKDGDWVEFDGQSGLVCKLSIDSAEANG